MLETDIHINSREHITGPDNSNEAELELENENVAEFFNQDMPESAEQTVAKKVLEDIEAEHLTKDKLRPDKLKQIYDKIIEHNNSRFSLDAIAHEVIKRILLNEIDNQEEKEIMSNIVGFHKYSSPELETYTEDGIGAEQIVDYHVEEILNLSNQDSELALEKINYILDTWKAVENKLDLAPGDRGRNIFTMDANHFLDLKWLKEYFEKKNDLNSVMNIKIIINQLEEEKIDEVRQKIIEDGQVDSQILNYLKEKNSLREKVLQINLPEINNFVQENEANEVEVAEKREVIEKEQLHIYYINHGIQFNTENTVESDVKEKIESFLEQDLEKSSQTHEPDIHFLKSVQELEQELSSHPDQKPNLILLNFDNSVEEKEKNNQLRILSDKLKENNVHARISIENKNEELDDELILSGADFIVRNNTTNTVESIYQKTINLITEEISLHPKILVKEKQDLYDEIVEFLKRREQHTADKNQEVKVIKKIIEDHFQDRKIKIIDAGSGWGRIGIPISEEGHQVTGVELSKHMLAEFNKYILKEKENINMQSVQGSLTELPAKEKSQDMEMFNWHVFCELRSTKAKLDALKEAYRVLDTGGIITLDLPDRRKLDNIRQLDGSYVYHFDNDDEVKNKEVVYRGYVPTIEEMEEWLSQTGFKNTEVIFWQTDNNYPKITIKAEKI